MPSQSPYQVDLDKNSANNVPLTFLYRHSAVLEAGVVARPDDKGGETHCAFVTLNEGASATTQEIIVFCRQYLAHFEAPKTVVFGPLAKTSTSKLQKFKLRGQARNLSAPAFEAHP